MERTVRREVILDATADELWTLLTDPVELGGWLGDEVQLDPTPGGAATVLTGDGTVRNGRVVEAEAGRRLGFTWWPEGDEGSASTVRFTIDQEGERTRLTVVETLPEPRASARNGAASACSVVDAGAAWDDRLLGLEVRMLARPTPVLAPA
jgi:uncharacterized protein YndB with AHSA1/START domain